MAERAKTKTPMREQPPEQRRHNFREVPYGYTEDEAVAEAQRCLGCPKKPCVAGCPVEIDIPEFIKRIAERDFAGAVRVLREKNSLPAICGRVCPQEDQCEKACVMGIKFEPVAIGRLERFAAEWAAEHACELPACDPPTGKKVACVGSGPASLTCAGDMARRGHDVTVFEALHKAGGVLVYGIPEFRLPKAILEREIDLLRELGVTFRTNAVIGKLFTLDDLREKFDAVFIGTGAGLPYFMDIPGENLNGVYSANEFLTRVNLMKAYDFPNAATPIKARRITAVIGGGNTAMDAARTALRLGCEVVYLVYRRTEAEMPARDEEIHHAAQEGVEFLLLQAPIEVLGDDKGWVRAMRVQRMELGEAGPDGRRRPVPIDGDVYELPVDTVIIAVSQGPNPLLQKTAPNLRTGKWGYIEVDAETGATSIPGVYAGGDITEGGTVILAMGAGRRAARAMHSYIINQSP